MTKNDNKKNKDLSRNIIHDLSNNNFFNIIYKIKNNLLLKNKPNNDYKPFKINPNITINNKMSNIINKKNSNYKYNNKYNNKNNIFSIRNTLDLNTNSYDFNFKNKKTNLKMIFIIF